MAKPNFAQLFKSVQTTVTKYSPEILTGIGIAGMITSTVLAVKATPKALQLIEEQEVELSNQYHEEVTLTPMETVKTTWKCYIPAAVTCATSVACLIGANTVHARRGAALATAYKLSEAALVEYKDKVIETIGEKKEQVVREKIAEDKIKQTPVVEQRIIKTGKGTTLCFDPLSSRYFYSDVEMIRRAENKLNKELLHSISGSVSVSDFYDEIGLPHTETSDDFGWNTDELIDLDISAHVTEDGEPAAVIGHYNRPKYEFARYL